MLAPMPCSGRMPSGCCRTRRISTATAPASPPAPAADSGPRPWPWQSGCQSSGCRQMASCGAPLSTWCRPTCRMLGMVKLEKSTPQNIGVGYGWMRFRPFLIFDRLGPFLVAHLSNLSMLGLLLQRLLG